MRALNHDAHEAESLELRHLLGVGADDGEFDAIREVFSLGVPANPTKLSAKRRFTRPMREAAP